MHKSIEDVIAEATVRDLQIRYCRAVDRMDFELLRSCFHPDAALEYGIFQGDLDGFVAMARVSLGGFSTTTHFTGNQLVEVSGATGWAEHYTTATHRLLADDSGPERDFVTIVRYVDKVERRQDEWRISKRILLLDSWRTDPVLASGPGPDVRRGQRDRGDHSYTILGSS